MVWSMALEALARLLMLDIAWFIGLIASNLILLFIFLAIGFFLYQNKMMFLSFLFVTFILWASIDFTRAIGWVLLDPRYLSINTIASIIVLAFAESDESLKNNLLVINTLRFLTVLIVFNLFLR